MKRTVLGVVAALTFGAAAAQTAPAPKPNALVRAEAGVVQVQGGATVEVDSGSAGINTGDTVTVADGSATVVYADGCTVQVSDSHQIAAVSPCKAGLVPSTGARATGTSKWAWGAVGVATAIGVAVAAGGGGDDKASSP